VWVIFHSVVAVAIPGWRAELKTRPRNLLRIGGMTEFGGAAGVATKGGFQDRPGGDVWDAFKHHAEGAFGTGVDGVVVRHGAEGPFSVIVADEFWPIGTYSLEPLAVGRK
jgi:hypothetical protein